MLMENEQNTDNSNDLSKDASEKLNQLKSVQKELEDIQSQCKHTNYSLKNVGPEKGLLFKLLRICDTCHKEMGQASAGELNNWLGK